MYALHTQLCVHAYYTHTVWCNDIAGAGNQGPDGTFGTRQTRAVRPARMEIQERT